MGLPLGLWLWFCSRMQSNYCLGTCENSTKYLCSMDMCEMPNIQYLKLVFIDPNFSYHMRLLYLVFALLQPLLSLFYAQPGNSLWKRKADAAFLHCKVLLLPYTNLVPYKVPIVLIQKGFSEDLEIYSHQTKPNIHLTYFSFTFCPQMCTDHHAYQLEMLRKFMWINETAHNEFKNMLAYIIRIGIRSVFITEVLIELMEETVTSH